MTRTEVEQLIETVQRGQELLDAQQRQERAMALQKFDEYHADMVDKYQRVLDEVYRSHRDLSAQLGEYEARNAKEREARQGVTDDHFWRIYIWLFLLTFAEALVVGAIAWDWWQP